MIRSFYTIGDTPGDTMKKRCAALAVTLAMTSAAQAGSVSDPEIEAPVIAAAAESSSLSAGTVMAIMTISILWAALDD